MRDVSIEVCVCGVGWKGEYRGKHASPAVWPVGRPRVSFFKKTLPTDLKVAL